MKLMNEFDHTAVEQYEDKELLKRLAFLSATDPCPAQQAQLKSVLERLLTLNDFSEVFGEADRVRRARKGDAVQIRAILEFSNHCRRSCRYCGLRRENRGLTRYRMQVSEIVAAANEAADAGYRTIVLQSGEDPWYDVDTLVSIVREVKLTGMAVTLSCGERTDEDYAQLRQAGADRYLIKHETADPELYRILHPCGTLEERVHCLKRIKQLGYETGSGFMVGLPTQTASTLAQDLCLLKELGCHMAGIGPFIPHPDTPLADQAPGDTELVKRCVALARLLLPDGNLPATTALGVLSAGEKGNVFSCGANVVMRKVTPDPYKSLYEIYPAKLTPTSVREDRLALEDELRKLDRIPV